MSATGSADFGISALAGARQAADDLNAGGGVLGKKVVIVERDDVGAPPKAIQNTNELIDNVKVNAMLGGVNSGNMLAWLHLVQQKKIPTISPVATATDITGRYAKSPPNYVFRVSMRDRDQIALLAAYAPAPARPARSPSSPTPPGTASRAPGCRRDPGPAQDRAGGQREVRPRTRTCRRN